MTQAKCLMLDVDGVLVFGRPVDGLHWIVGLENDIGVVPHDLANAFFRAGWREVVTGQAALLPTLQAALDDIAPKVRAEVLRDYWFEMSSHIVQPVLSDLRAARQRGVPVFLATNQCHMRAAYLLDTVGLRREVDGIIYSAQAGAQKPEPGFYAFAEVHSGYAADDLLMVDDTPDNIIAAKAAGWQGIHWDGSARLADIVERYFT